MRIIGGTLSGRRLEGSPGSLTRPTSERAREGLASALQARGAFEGARVLELFAGTGVFSFEALSRGAHSAVCIDKSPACARTIQENATILRLEDRIVSQVIDLCGLEAAQKVTVPQGKFTLVFADPPYERTEVLGPLLQALAQSDGFADGAWVAMEHPSTNPPTPLPDLTLEADYRYGGTSIRLARFWADNK